MRNQRFLLKLAGIFKSYLLLILIAVLAMELSIIGSEASYVIQLATLMTFIVSAYVIVQRYPTPIALSDELRRD